MKQPKSFFNRLEKILSEKPDNCDLVYDMASCQLFVIRKGFEFHEGTPEGGGTSWHGVLSPVSEPKASTGHDERAIVGEGLYVPMEAVRT